MHKPETPPPRSFVDDDEVNPAPRTRSALTYFVLTFALSIPFWVAGALTTVQLLPAIPVSALGLLCMVGAASILVYRENGRAGVVALLKRSFDIKRVKAKIWYVPILLLMPGIMALSYVAMRLAGMAVVPATRGAAVRPIETLLSLANLLTFFVVAVPQPRAVRWMRYWVPIALLIAVAQVLVEGQRWQMVPAYVLAALFFLIWLLSIVKRGSLHSNRLAAGLGIGLGTLVFILSIALPIMLPVFHFPKPTGPYAIGTATYHWVDTSRQEFFTSDSNDHRELMAQVWYPAKKAQLALRAAYIQDADVVTPAMGRVTHLPEFLFAHFKYVTTNAVPSTPIADEKSSYPVLIFSSGLDGFRAVSTFQIEELVSHGYIVVGLDQPGAVAAEQYPEVRFETRRP